MPRNAGVSGRSTIWFIFFSPSARTITLCFSGVQIEAADQFDLDRSRP